MKTKFLNLFLILFLTAVTNHSLAQSINGQSILTIGAGLSIANFVNNNNTVYGTGNIKYTCTPVFTGIYDYQLGNIFSIGASISYQENIYECNNCPYYVQSTYPVQQSTISWEQKSTQTNYGIRSLFYASKTENLDVYGGLRFGYSVVTVSNNDPNIQNGYYQRINNGFFWPSAYTIQGLAGARYYPVPYFGITTEIAIGVPYFALLGVSFKFGTSSTSPSTHE